MSTVPSSRLLALLGQSLKWQQQQQGVVVPGSSYDIFRGTVPVQKAEDDAFISNHYVSIKFPGKKTYAECAAFSKDGTYLATGSMDGFIEIWNYLTGKLRKDLKYQAKDRLMAMDKAVLCLEFSPNNELLASGSMDGKVIVWKVQTGQRQRIISPAHTEGVTCVCFSKDSTQIVSGSHDQTVRIHGLKSGKMLKEFRGHTSFVNAVLYSSDSSRILSASSDGTLKIWDVKTTDCLYTVTPQPKLEKNELNPVGGLGSASVQAIVPVPRKQDHYIVCNKTNTLFLVSLRGQIVKTYTHNKKHDFITAAVSAQGDYIYGISEDSVLYCFQLATGAAVGNFKICDSEIVGMASHPLANILVVHDDAGHVYFYKA